MLVGLRTLRRMLVVRGLRVEKEGMRKGRLWDKLRMRIWEWERLRIISRLWQQSYLSSRKMSVILLAEVRDVRRKLSKMEMDNGVVKGAIRVGIHLFIGIILPSEQCADNRFIMTISVNDHTSQAWFNLFNDSAQKILGVDATTLVEYKETDTAKANEVFNKANFNSWVVRGPGKQDNFQGQVRVRYQVLDVYPVDYKS